MRKKTPPPVTVDLPLELLDAAREVVDSETPTPEMLERLATAVTARRRLAGGIA